MKLVDIIATAWLLALFLCVLLAPFVMLGVIIMYIAG